MGDSRRVDAVLRVGSRPDDAAPGRLQDRHVGARPGRCSRLPPSRQRRGRPNDQSAAGRRRIVLADRRPRCLDHMRQRRARRKARSRLHRARYPSPWMALILVVDTPILHRNEGEESPPASHQSTASAPSAPPTPLLVLSAARNRPPSAQRSATRTFGV